MMCTNELLLPLGLSLQPFFVRARQEQGRTMRQKEAPLAFAHSYILTENEPTRIKEGAYTFFLFLGAQLCMPNAAATSLARNSYGSD